MNYNKLLFTMEAIFMKLCRKILSVFLVCVFAMTSFTLTGCKTELEGTYKFNKMEYVESGMSVAIKVGEKFMGMVTITEDYCKITLNADGTATAVMAEDVSDGTWEKASDEKIKITFDGETQMATCDGKTLVIEIDGSTLTLKK